MLGLILLGLTLFVVAYLLLLVPDYVLAVVGWVYSVLSSAFAPLGVSIPDYLSQIMPFLLSSSQILALGLAAIAVLVIAFAIREEV